MLFSRICTRKATFLVFIAFKAAFCMPYRPVTSHLTSVRSPVCESMM